MATAVIVKNNAVKEINDIAIKQAKYESASISLLIKNMRIVFGPRKVCKESR